ncbi:hypothetical protein VII00023_00885 [Vibrio ichthyoenteri ATCC 700023]|uniref:Uncharacterized protein n=1 Tax=Vibrio ichthyoenteri ATCC 700023 TaxID=870968 RepID=F9S5Y7_9VIBR|nr:hypothetical protein [Vibrio ichthyoenteri]EGU34601.1 hypothetical protein VII00023_00885 [Vibrio ichthyoenteri ATCC 700023]
MAAYKIIYLNDSNELIKSETVFMRGLRGAKTSSASRAPSCTVKIELRDIADRLLAFKENNRWKECTA